MVLFCYACESHRSAVVGRDEQERAVLSQLYLLTMCCAVEKI